MSSKLKLIVMFLILSCNNKREKTISSKIRNEVLIYDSVSRKSGFVGQLNASLLAKSDSEIVDNIQARISHIVSDDKIFKSYLTKLNEPFICDSTKTPSFKWIRLLYLDFDNLDNYSFYASLNSYSENNLLVVKKFKLKIIDNKKLDFHSVSADSFEVNHDYIQTLQGLLYKGNYWNFNGRAGGPTCSFNQWYIETLKEADDQYPYVYKRVYGRGRLASLNEFMDFMVE